MEYLWNGSSVQHTSKHSQRKQNALAQGKGVLSSLAEMEELTQQNIYPVRKNSLNSNGRLRKVATWHAISRDENITNNETSMLSVGMGMTSEHFGTLSNQSQDVEGRRILNMMHLDGQRRKSSSWDALTQEDVFEPPKAIVHSQYGDWRLPTWCFKVDPKTIMADTLRAHDVSP
jgi:hypothetical protein